MGPTLSRLLGFLQFRRHCILMEKINAIRTQKENINNSQVLELLGKTLTESLSEAWTILQNDASCPPQLTELITLMHRLK